MNDAPEAPEAAEVFRINLSTKRAAYVLVAVITAIGTAAAAYFSHRPGDVKDYGSEVRALQREYGKYVEWRDSQIEWRSTVFEEWKDFVELSLQQIKSDRAECIRRVAKNEAAIEEHDKFSKDTVNDIIRFHTRIDGRVEHNEIMIKDCIRRTQ